VVPYQENGLAIVAVGSFAESGAPAFPLGESRTCEGENLSRKVWHTGRPARTDSYERPSGSIAARMRELGIRSRVGAPIIVDERVWGLAVVGSKRPEPLPRPGPKRPLVSMRKLRLLRQDDHEKTTYISQGEHTRHPLFEMS
jgi:GAF domain-containing protein